ncbi:FMRFamide-activated amiloride-sensitive sodium channel [Nephila pilipes]|uniref:FMRFamide-activated amiloride-sensitive sodium channel n=1 Tax=Nephila pilipes TaxID=299642 RepID=A0A8X6PVJ3_NEPPI|nr:FMRFamide-activated amiloride-sensitive sodium channel [Nephila pilipes]
MKTEAIYDLDCGRFEHNFCSDYQGEKATLKKDTNPNNFLSNFIGNSSVYAVSQVGQEKTKPRKIFWLLALLTCLCGCVYEMKSFLSVFLEYPVLIDLEVRNEGNLKFPAVTVCNLNRIKQRNEDCVYEDRPWLKCFQPSVKMIPYNNPVIFSERKTHTSISNATTKLLKKFKLVSQNFLNHYTNLDADSRYCYGYTL